MIVPQRRRVMRTTNRILVVSGAFALLAAACGDDSSSSPSAAGPKPVPIHVAAGGNQARTAAPSEAAAGDSVDAARPDIARLMPINFVLSATLPALDSGANGWKLAAGVQPDAAAVEAIAAVFGVSGRMVTLGPDAGAGWVVGPPDYTGPAVFVNPDAMLSWYFSDPGANPKGGVTCGEGGPAVDVAAGAVHASGIPDEAAASTEVATTHFEPDTVPPCETPAPPLGVPGKDAATSKAEEYLRKLGVDPATVQIEAYADEYAANVTAFVSLDGHRSPLQYSFGFGENGRLTYASGTLAAPQPAGEYQRIGTVAGFERLKSQQTGFGYPTVAGAEGIASSSYIASSGWAAAPPCGDAASCVATVPVPVPDAPVESTPVTVTITSVEEVLTQVWDVDGTVWIVPGYTFVSDAGERYEVAAIADELLVPAIPVEEKPVATFGPGPDVTVRPDPASVPITQVVPPIQIEPTETFSATVPADGYVGLSEAEATKLAESNGLTVRVVERDGVRDINTDDFRQDRVNLTIVGGKVTIAEIY